MLFFLTPSEELLHVEVAKLGNGGTLRTYWLVLREFESLPLHHAGIVKHGQRRRTQNPLLSGSRVQISLPAPLLCGGSQARPNGAGLKIRSLVVQGFKSLPPHHIIITKVRFIYDVAYGGGYEPRTRRTRKKNLKSQE